MREGAGRPAALVTGAASRIGRSFALHLASRGFDIALHYCSSEKESERTAYEIVETGVDCERFGLDLADSSGVEHLILDVHRVFPRLSLLVNCASVYFDAPSRDTSRAQLDLCMAVNFAAPYVLVREFSKLCGEGLVVNILDNKIFFNQYHYSPYLLSKQALAEFTKQAALEYAPEIRVNAIAPGVVLPADNRSESYLRWRISGIPLGRRGNVGHLNMALDYLIENQFVAGQILTVDGGESRYTVGRNLANYDEAIGE